MSNSLILTEQFIRNSEVRQQEWIEIRTQDQTIYRNVQQLLFAQQKKAILLQRAQFGFPHAPKMFYVKQSNQYISILIQRGKNNILNFQRRNNKNNEALVKYYEDTMRAFNNLKNMFGCFFITQNMIKINEVGKLLVWFHENFIQLKPQYPLPPLSGEKTMIWIVNKIFQNNLGTSIIQGQSFAQILLQLQQDLNITTNPIKTSQSFDDIEIQDDITPYFMPPSMPFITQKEQFTLSFHPARKIWYNQNQISSNFEIELISFGKLQSKSSLLNFSNIAQQKSIGTLIKEKCRKQQRQKQNKDQLYYQLQPKQQTNRSLFYNKKIENNTPNPFIYGTEQKQCSSPLKRQLTIQLNNLLC